jgi:AraC family transcriptional regulator
MEKEQVLDQTENPTTEAFAIAPSRFENGAAMVLAGLNQRYTYDNMETIPAQWERFVPYLGNVPARMGRVDYGVVVSTPDGKGFDYMTAFEVSDTSQLPADFTTREVPAQRYAVFPHPGPVVTMCETIDAIFDRWLPDSGCEMTGAPDFLERYGEKFNPEIGAGDIEIWLPVKG